MFACIFILLFGYVICFDMPPSWINPSDLHHSRKIGGKHASSVPSVEDDLIVEEEGPAEPRYTIKNESCLCPAQALSASDSYLKRMINLLLYESQMKNYRLPKGNFRMVPLTLHFTSDNLEILHSFASTENLGSFAWSDFDQAFSSLFEKPKITEENQEKIHVSHHDYTNFIFLTIVGSFLIYGLWLLFTSGSLYKSVCGIGFLNFGVSLFWNLIRAYNREKEKIRQLKFNSSVPTYSFWSDIIGNPLRRLFGTSISDTTFDEVPLPENDPLFNIDFGEIVVETLGTVFHILPIIGEKSGKMFSEFYGSQNFFVKWFVQPVQLLLNPIILLIFLLLVAIVQKGFSIKLPFFSIGVGGSDEQPTKTKSPRTKPPKPLRITQQPVQAPIQDRYDAGSHDAFIARTPQSAFPIRRIITEFHAVEARIKDRPQNRVKDKPQKLPSITYTNKGRIMKRRHNTSTSLASHLQNELPPKSE